MKHRFEAQFSTDGRKDYPEARQDWETPHDLFATLDSEFHFTLDVAATQTNKKVETCFTESDNGLLQPWGGRVWMNPPYGRDVERWMAKLTKEVFSGRVELAVALVPTRFDTQWFLKYGSLASEARFISGRLRFQGAKASAPFPSVVLVFNMERAGAFQPSFIDRCGVTIRRCQG